MSILGKIFTNITSFLECQQKKIHCFLECQQKKIHYFLECQQKKIHYFLECQLMKIHYFLEYQQKKIHYFIKQNWNNINIISLLIPLYYANYKCNNIALSYTINNIYLYYLYANKNIIINYITFLNSNLIYAFIYIVPLMYDFFINTNLLQSIRITSIYTYELINNKDYIFQSIFLPLLEYILYIKIYITDYYKSFLNHNFIVTKVELYIDLNNKINVTEYFKNNQIDKIDKNLIDILFIENNIFIEKDNNTRLKIYFKYNLINYIIYYSYKSFNNNTNESNYYLPFPIFNKDIIDNLKNDIILPYYNKTKNKKDFYSLFQIESKDILLTCVNDIHNKELFEYFNLIKTPFNDFGILYNVPVKLNWILVENNIDIEIFESFYLKFLSVYFCETEFDIKEHFIKMDNNDLEKIIISERMKMIMNFN